MGTMFSGTEIIDIAVGIENNGVAFYDTLAKLATDDSMQTTYNNLAEMERNHVRVFENMRKSVSDYTPQGEYDEDYDLYLKGLVNSSVFTDDKAASEMARGAKDQAEALHIAILAEKDSILFYNEIRNLVAPSDRPMIDTIVSEEREHVRSIMQTRSALLGQ